jgi:FMN phosphatase YigB (HAD superfamily)
MAAQSTVIGTGITQAPNVDFGQVVRQGVQDIITQQDKIKAEKERQEAKRAELYDKYGFDEELAVLPDSEFRTANDAALEAVSKLRDRYYDVYKQLEGNPNNIELRKRLGNITNNIKRLKATHE